MQGVSLLMTSIIGHIGSLLNGEKAFTATIQTFFVKVFILSLSVGTGIITARVLGPEGRGEIAAMLLWSQFLAYCLTLGLPQSLVFNLKRYPEEKDNLFSLGLVFSIFLGFLASTIGIIFIPIWLSQYSQSTIQSAQWLVLLAPLATVGVFFVAAFEAREEFTFANQLRYSIPVLTLIGMLFLLLIGVRSPVAFALTYALPSIPVTIWMYFRLKNLYKISFNNVQSTSRRLLDYGIKAYGIDLLGTLSNKVGEALVVSLITATSMGLFTVALSLSRMLNVFEDAIQTILLPKTSARPINEIVEITGRAVRTSTFLTLICVIPLMILGPFFVSLLYGEEFLGAIPVLRILLIEVLLSGITWMLAKAFMAVGKPGIVTTLQGFALAVSVPLMLILVPRYGLIGVGISLLTSTSLRLLFILVCYPLILHSRPPNLIFSLNDFRYIRQSIQRR
jgi:enterobacterial common antigen flippase